MTIQHLKDNNLLLFECISGSKAYGLDTATSDTDIKGVFVMPKDQFYGLHWVDQVNNETNDEVYYELRKFMELLAKNNPNILDLVATPKDCILFQHLLYEKIRPEYFVSKLCKNTFAGYAMTQVKKAKGLSKKILNPVEKERKSVLDFCYVPFGQGAVAVMKFLDEKGLKQECCGLTRIPHMHEVYGLYYSEEGIYKGIIQSEQANEVSLSSIPKDVQPITIMSFNKAGYSKYCKDYKEYWNWVEKRNDTRYQNTIEHGKNYDAKNMMHTFRLLDMAAEIGKTGIINVRRPNREFLLQIKKGVFQYDELVKQAEKKLSDIESVYSQSGLPEEPDSKFIDKLLIELRTEFYGS
ncbi:nucleotidyltransferase domain-containing protein [Fulvivirgaceae bacterium BMA12]|uniref:Nucleotidyltransferase domain-containing protein n=1 Tax=Agaribacillus aureus TaxID=3051825 RepID=A0ABT8LB13_9BACT|nr:nucleotidyltransferase domain-containing protein [Fulvivirgaceae bacterium BMA12]